MKKRNSNFIRKTIAIAAEKGDVGRSTLTCLLALVFQKKGYKVGILDADLYGLFTKKMLPGSMLLRYLSFFFIETN